MATNSIFPGTDQERDDLLAALTRNCTCGTTATEPDGRCAGHIALVDDPRWLYDQLFARSMRDRLNREEHGVIFHAE